MMNLALKYNASTAAFTLLEMLLALAIAAVVLAAINAVFFGALHMQSRSTEAASQTMPVDRAVATMKQDLLGIVPPGVLAGLMGTDATATGVTQTPILEIFTSSGIIRDEVPWGDIQKIDYWLQVPTNAMSSSGKDLVRGITRNLLSTTTEGPDQQQVIIGDVQSLQFSFYDGTNWAETWSTTLSNIPAAIKVQIAFTAPKSGKPMNSPVQFLIPVVSQSRTNASTTNSVSN
ncbi:MAG: hypothetical protein JWR26_2505 [Pedosphaera sp.]|nr:hypothetical protein [Pedosphaera sp.]